MSTRLYVYGLTVACMLIISCGGDENEHDKECQKQLDAYTAAAAGAQSCDPSATTPCVGIEGGTAKDFSCDYTGVNPDAAATLTAIRQTYGDLGCPPGNEPPCPNTQAPAYACQPDGSGGNACAAQQ